MIVCIIAGGSGTRLWPLSTPDYPKHLLKVNGEERSLLQSAYDRAKSIASDVYVITEAGHAHHIKEQLPDLNDENFVIEPARRGTANCIVAALDRVSRRHDQNEVVAMIHSDHFIRDLTGFGYSFRIAEAASKKENRIVLVGVEPDYPATIFGYIKKLNVFDEESLVYNVDSFKEKPDHKTAQEFVKSGQYLWNCGYFVGSVATFKEKMESRAPDLAENFRKLNESKNDEEYNEHYLSFVNDAIDYALMEKMNDLLVVPASFDWMDFGSFRDIHKAVGGDQDGNYTGGDVLLEGVENSYVLNQEDKPLVVIGLDNIAVVNTKNGIVITRKDLDQKVGDAAKRIASREK